MNTDDTNQNADSGMGYRSHHNLRPFRDEGRLRGLRQWINALFLLLACVGMLLYFAWDRDVALYILVVACVLKFVELTLRIAKL